MYVGVSFVSGSCIKALTFANQVGQFLETVSPYAWADLGIALCIGLSVVGAAWYVANATLCRSVISKTHICPTNDELVTF